MAMAPQHSDAAKRVQAAAAVKAERQALAGLTRAIRLRIYPSPNQANEINRTIGAIRFVWNQVWVPMVEDAEAARWSHVKANGWADDLDKEQRLKLWKAAWRDHPDPKNSTALTKAKDAKAADPDSAWLQDVPKTPFHRAAKNFVDAVKASRARTPTGQPRKLRAGKVRPKSRRDDPYSGLEWQQQGNQKDESGLGGKPIRDVVDTATRTVKVPNIGTCRYRDKGKLLNRYLRDGGEVCELTVKRDGPHYYVSLAIRGLPKPDAHLYPGTVIGLDMGVSNPVATSNGDLIRSHAAHDIAQHMVRLRRLKRRVQRQCSRKFYAAAKAADALTDTGAIKKGATVPKSNRLRRAEERMRKIDRHLANYRADWQRNVALKLARHSEIIVVEDLRIQDMTKSAAGDQENPGRNVRAKAALNREILARGWYAMQQRLRHKAEEYAGQVVEVDPRYTSQECPECGTIDRENRKTQAQFRCVSCGHEAHADVVGAINILGRHGKPAGALPVAGRGGDLNVSASQEAVGAGADEPSNKSTREPKVSPTDVEGSHVAKPHNAIKELAATPQVQKEGRKRPASAKSRGSRNEPD